MNPKANLIFSPDAPLKAPGVAAKIATVHNSWATVDATVANVFAIFMDDKAELGMAMYNQFMHSGVHVTVLDATAEAVLEKDTVALDLYYAVKKVWKAPRDERNEITHGNWGWSGQLPGMLILHPTRGWLEILGQIGAFYSRTMAESELTILRRIAQHVPEEIRPKIPAQPEFPKAAPTPDEVWVYRAEDFDGLLRQMNEASIAWHEFAFLIRGGAPATQAPAKLYSMPLVLQTVNERRKGRGESPIPPP